MPERYEYEFHSPGGLEPVENRDWWAQARCNDLAGTMSGLFFSEELQDIAKAKQICALCPVMSECLEGALERRHRPSTVVSTRSITNQVARKPTNSSRKLFQ